jgi:hypothetical protein
MTRDEAVALIRPFLPTNPTHPSTHVSIPLEALKKVLADLDEAIKVGDVVCAAQAFRASPEEEERIEREAKRAAEKRLFEVIYGRMYSDIEGLQIEVQNMVQGQWEYPRHLDELGCNWGCIRRILAEVKQSLREMRKYDMEERP